MAYGIKYRFKWMSGNGVLTGVLIYKDGYTGTVYDRAIGSGHVKYRRENSERIYGTSLEISAECNVDGEYSEFYTAGTTDYLVQLFRGSESNVIWQGYVVPEAYSEPYISCPYDVAITATDGLGVKKFVKVDEGVIPVFRSVKTILENYLGAGNVYLRDTLIGLNDPESATDVKTGWNLLANMTICLKPYADDGKTEYDVLQDILKSFNWKLSYWHKHYIIWRESDVPSSAFTAVNSEGSEISVAAVAITSASNTTGYWPIGNMSRSIVKAVKTTTAKCTYKLRDSALYYPDMSANVWNKGSYATYNTKGYYFLKRGDTYATATEGYIYQSTPIALAPDEAWTLKIQAVATNEIGLGNVLEVYITQNCGGTIWYLSQNNGWVNSESHIELYVSSDVNTLNNLINSGTKPDEYTISVPIVGDGVITVKLYNHGDMRDFYIAGCYLYRAVSGDGKQCVVTIDNSYRDNSETDDIYFSEYPEIINSTLKAYNSFGGCRYGFHTAKVGELLTSFLECIALDYALDSSLPRLQLEGTLNYPANADAMPLLFTLGGFVYNVETYDIDFIDDEIQSIKALSQVAASMTVESATTSDVTNTSNSGASSSGNIGSSSAHDLLSITLNGVSAASDIWADTSAALSLYAPLTGGSAGQILQANGDNSAPSWIDVLSVAQGGTGASAFAVGEFIVGGSTSTSALSTITAASALQKMADALGSSFTSAGNDYIVTYNGTTLNKYIKFADTSTTGYEGYFLNRYGAWAQVTASVNVAAFASTGTYYPAFAAAIGSGASQLYGSTNLSVAHATSGDTWTLTNFRALSVNGNSVGFVPSSSLGAGAVLAKSSTSSLAYEFKQLSSLLTGTLTINGVSYKAYNSTSANYTIYAPISLGTSGQVLAVNSAGNGLVWTSVSGVSVTDVTVNGTSVVSSNVAVIEMPIVADQEGSLFWYGKTPTMSPQSGDSILLGLGLYDDKGGNVIFGYYNVEPTATNGFIIGNGTSSARSNAFEVRSNGTIYGWFGGIYQSLQTYLSTFLTTAHSQTLNINGTAYQSYASSANSATIYAPATAGESGQVATSNGTGAPTWSDKSSLMPDVIFSALLAEDDNTITNIFGKETIGATDGNGNPVANTFTWHESEISAVRVRTSNGASATYNYQLYNDGAPGLHITTTAPTYYVMLWLK